MGARNSSAAAADLRAHVITKPSARSKCSDVEAASENVGLTGNDTSGPIAAPDRGAKRGSFAQEEPEAPDNSAKAARMTPSDPSQLHGVVLKATQGVKGTKAKRARSASPEIGHGPDEPSLQPPRSSNGSAGGSKAAKAEPAAKAVKNGAARERKPAVENVSRFSAKQLAVRDTGAGQIKEVHVTNFMCHANMKVELQPHVNFISGPNGSGKSAILQALQFCLGVRANQTGRSGKNLDYLKKGTEICTASVTIWNTGDESQTFRAAELGPTITIAKTLNAKGNSSTRVLDAAGRKTNISKADDVKRMLQALNVNAANPSIVLTQDHARGLLSGDKVNRRLYDLLSESLGFEATLGNLSHAYSNIKRQEEDLEGHRKKDADFKEQIEELSKRVALAEDAERRIDLAEKIEDAIAWVIARNIQRQIEEEQVKLARMGPEARQHHEARLEALDAQLLERQQAVNELESVRERVGAAMREHEERKKELAAARRSKMNAKNAASKKQKDVEQKMRVVEEDRGDAEESMRRAETRGATNAAGRELAAWVRRRDAARAAITATQDAAAGLRAEVNDAAAAVDAADVAETSARKEDQESEKALRDVQSELAAMRRHVGGRGQAAAMWGREAPALLDAIAREPRRFSAPPIGPIGAHLSLRDPQYSATITGALKGLLPSFVVSTRRDMLALQELAKELRVDVPNIYTYNYAVPQHNVPASAEPGEDLTTVRRVLQVKEGTPNAHVLWNVLIDQGQVERLVLCPDDETGSRLLQTRCSREPQIGTIWCRDDRAGPVQMQLKGHSETSFPWNGAPPRAMLSSDLSSIIRDREQQLAAAEEARGAAHAALRTAQQAHAEAKSRLKDARTRSADNQTALHRQQRELDQLDAAQPAAPDEGGDEVAQWAAELRELDAKVARLQPEAEAFAMQVAEADAELRAATEARDAHAKEGERVQKELQGNLDYIDEHRRERAKLEKKREGVERERAKAADSEAQLRNGIEALQASRATALADALDISTEAEFEAELPALRAQIEDMLGQGLRSANLRVDDVLVNPAALEQLCEKARTRATKINEEADGDLETLRSDLAVKEKERAYNVAQASNILATVALLRKGYKLRLKTYHDIQSFEQALISSEFKRKLKTGRNWKGQIDIDYENKVVLLHVVPTKGASAGQTNVPMKDLKALSGGERSFTLVSFILSLGAEVSTPFFAMDEFDVFMDAVNRKVSLTSILKFAHDMQHVQFLLLSPLDMAVVEQSRADFNDGLRAAAMAAGSQVEEMPKSFIHTLAMQPPRDGARAHF